QRAAGGPRLSQFEHWGFGRSPHERVLTNSRQRIDRANARLPQVRQSWSTEVLHRAYARLGDDFERRQARLARFCAMLLERRLISARHETHNITRQKTGWGLGISVPNRQGGSAYDAPTTGACE